MDLREYLFKKRLTAKEFSDQVNLSYMLVLKAKASEPIGRRAAVIIEKATNGHVTKEDLVFPKEQEIFED